MRMLSNKLSTYYIMILSTYLNYDDLHYNGHERKKRKRKKEREREREREITIICYVRN